MVYNCFQKWVKGKENCQTPTVYVKRTNNYMLTYLTMSDCPYQKWMKSFETGDI